MTLTMIEALGLLLLIAAVGSACFYSGWRSAQSYLNSALAVSKLTEAMATHANSYAAELDKSRADSAMLRASVDRLAETVNGKQGDVEAALYDLVHGFERAGFIRAPRPGPPEQVGEKRPE
jgi:hypothetical protein